MALEKQRQTFISYSRANKDFAVRLAKELKSSGFSVWLDQLDIPTGARWDDELEKALEACEIFMVILTPASMASDNVKDEIGYAIDNHKRILPVLLENATIPFRLRRFQYVDFTTKSYDEGIESARQLLRSLVNQPTIPKSPIPAISQDQQALTEVKEEDERLKQKIEEERRVRAKVELERRAKEERGATEWSARSKANKEANKPSRLPFGAIVGLMIALALCGYAAIRFLPPLLVGSSPAPPVTRTIATNSPPVATTVAPEEPLVATTIAPGQPLVATTVAPEQPLVATTVAPISDPINEPIWDGAGTNIVPENEVGQSFISKDSILFSVEVAIITMNPGQGGDTITMKILSKDRQILTQVSQFVAEGFDGWLRYEIPNGGLEVGVHQTVIIQLEDTGSIVFGWKYSQDTYPGGSAIFYGSNKPWDFFFRVNR